MVGSANFSSDGESVAVKQAKRKRTMTGSSSTPVSREKSLRRSGRVVKHSARIPDTMSDESAIESKSSKKTRRITEISEHPESMSSSDDLPPPRRLSESRPIRSARGETQAAMEAMEQALNANREDTNPDQRRDADRSKVKYGRKSKTRTGGSSLHGTEGLLAKHDRVIEGKDREIAHLEEQLKNSRSLQAGSRMALENRDEELATLKAKHKQLVKAASIFTDMYGGFDELARAVDEAAD